MYPIVERKIPRLAKDARHGAPPTYGGEGGGKFAVSVSGARGAPVDAATGVADGK